MFWNKKKILVTHNGGFHSDDIFACATLQIYLEKMEEEYRIIRTRDEKEISRADFVFDVGGEYSLEKNRFDHHQKGGAGVRENGVSYAAFGLVWKAFGEGICGNREVAEEIDKRLVQPIDANDNGIDVYTSKIEGVSPVTFQDIVGAYYPEDGASEEEYLRAFLELALLAKSILEKSISKTKKQFSVNLFLKNLYESTEIKKLLVVEERYSRHEVTVGALYLPEVLYVIYPSKRGDEWNIVATREKIESMKSKKPFPEDWAGRSGADLGQKTNIATAKFCHNSGFLCVAETKQDAIALAYLAIKS